MGCKITDLGLDTLVLEEIVISSTLEPSLIMRLRSSNERFDAAKQTKTTEILHQFQTIQLLQTSNFGEKNY